jgi:hypothetical protein
MLDLLEIKYTNEDINNKRTLISSLIKEKSINIKESCITILSGEDLRELFELYDDIFFMSSFKKNYKGKIKFSLSKRMTKSAGSTVCPKNISSIREEDLVLEIKIGIDFFFNYDKISGDKLVCGHKTDNCFHALQLVFEHELCHVIEFMIFHQSSCKKERFKSLAYNIFKHTASYHGLPTQKEIAMEILGIKVGDNVSFVFEGINRQGFIYKINKRAIIMVKDKNGNFMDKDRNRYIKYYVPLNKIIK